jgi:hypothetical protein
MKNVRTLRLRAKNQKPAHGEPMFRLVCEKNAQNENQWREVDGGHTGPVIRMEAEDFDEGTEVVVFGP